MGKRKEGLKEITEGFKQVVSNSGTKSSYKGQTPKGESVTGKQVVTTGEQRLAKMQGVGKMLKGAFHVLFNHGNWYTNYPESKLVNVNLSTVRGQTELDYPIGTGSTSIPSVCSIVLQNTIPQDTGWNEGIKRIFSTLRQANRSNLLYTQYDLEKYILACRGLHTAYCYLRRAYAAALTYKTLDRAIPEQLLIAMGIDPNDFQAHLADIRMFGTRLGSYIATNAPLNLPLFDRVRWLFGNVFADSNDAKPNYYLFSLGAQVGTQTYQGVDSFYINEDNNWVFDRVNINNAIGSSDTTHFGCTAQFMIDQINILLYRFNNNVFATIAGDILNAFGSESINRAEEWRSDEPLSIIYDEAALTQIQNIQTIGVKNSADDTTVLDIFCQTTGTVPNSDKFMNELSNDTDRMYMTCAAAISWPNTTIPDGLKNLMFDVYGNPYVNWYKDSITAGEIMSAVRFTSPHVYLMNKTDTNIASVYYDNISTETALLMFTFRKVKDYPVVTNPYNVYKVSATTVSTSFIGSGASDTDVANICAGIVGKFSDLSSFDYQPKFYYYFYTADGAGNNYNRIPFFDFNVYARVSYKDIANYHTVANMSLLYTPFLKKSTKTEAVNFGA